MRDVQRMWGKERQERGAVTLWYNPAESNIAGAHATGQSLKSTHNTIYLHVCLFEWQFIETGLRPAAGWNISFEEENSNV